MTHGTHTLEWRAADRPGKLSRGWCAGCSWAIIGKHLTEPQARENHALHVSHMEDLDADRA